MMTTIVALAVVALFVLASVGAMFSRQYSRDHQYEKVEEPRAQYGNQGPGDEAQ